LNEFDEKSSNAGIEVPDITPEEIDNDIME